MNFCENFDLLRVEKFVVYKKWRKTRYEKKKEKKLKFEKKKKEKKLARAIQTKVCWCRFFEFSNEENRLKDSCRLRAFWRRSINDEFF
jgi:hypothetical protein